VSYVQMAQAAQIEELEARIAELEAVMTELIAATNEFVGWHRTDKIVVRDVERIEDWRKARDAAREVLQKSET
jgi:hypothetical protein